MGITMMKSASFFTPTCFLPLQMKKKQPPDIGTGRSQHERDGVDIDMIACINGELAEELHHIALTDVPTDVTTDGEISDNDSCDADDQLPVLEYAEELFEFYLKIEVKSCVDINYMSYQHHIDEDMRASVINSLIKVHYSFEDLGDETLYLAVNILDRFLEKRAIRRDRFQLLGIAALLVAWKYEEDIVGPDVNDLLDLSGQAYTRDDIFKMEKLILETLEYELTVPTPCVYVKRFLEAAESDKMPRMEVLSYFILELSLLEYEMLKFKPSMLAAAAIYTAQCTLRGIKYWTKSCEMHTKYSEYQLL
ncbi:cyclin-B2-2-like [Zingiber officinale]|uniref:cyclin-B2-2-like n=1 Tax=Zingiber officinale TaxID=94328 RepID=UPI001C4C0185|nr:cyclin-B2-2-like [Zingiber officinale]